MKTLYLLRHGKSQPPDFNTDDFDRSLNERGVYDCEIIGQWLTSKQSKIDKIVVSGARRTRETHERLVETFQTKATVELEEALYLARSEFLRGFVRRLEDDLQSVMLIGHNPGMHELAFDLCKNKKDTVASELQEKFPTCALAVIQFHVESWGLIESGEGKLIHFITPRMLKNR